MLELLFTDEAGRLLGAAMSQRGGGAAAAPTLQSITVTPTNPTWRPVSAADRQQFTATGNYSDGSTQDLTNSATWASTDVGTATISNAGGTQGQATAVSANNGATGAARTSTITATFDAVVGSTTLSVDTARDATSGIRVPANAYQWTTLLGYTPSHLWLCQEASGNLADSIGAVALTASGTIAYQQAASGWSRQGVGFSDGVSGAFSVNAGSGPNPASQSVAWLIYCDITATPAAVRSIGSITRGTGSHSIRINTTPRVQLISTFGSATGTADPVAGAMVAYLAAMNVTGNTDRIYTSQELLGAVNGSWADGQKGIGGVGAVPPSSVIVYAAAFSGANAEAADTKNVLLALGWTPPY